MKSPFQKPKPEQEKCCDERYPIITGPSQEYELAMAKKALKQVKIVGLILGILLAAIALVYYVRDLIKTSAANPTNQVTIALSQQLNAMAQYTLNLEKRVNSLRADLDGLMTNKVIPPVVSTNAVVK